MRHRIFAVFCAVGLLLLAASCGQKQQTQTIPPPGTESPLTLQWHTPDTPEEPADTAVRISIAAAGDNIAHDSVMETARSAAKDGEAYDFAPIYAGIRELISSADIAFVNQEAPVGGAELGISGYPNFNAPHEQVEALIELGFDVFNIANNHMLDKGAKGYGNTVEYFNSLPITMIGGYKKSDRDQIRVVDCKGVKIAFLGYTTFVNYGHKNDLPSSSEYMVPYADTEDITRQVGLAKAQADAVIVSFHWGTEDEFGITGEQEKLAKLCADLGVDVVLGHHPHVVGQVKYVEGAAGNKTLVAYSLGNLCSTMLYAQNMVGEILTFDIVREANGSIRVENALVNPVISHYSCNTNKLDNQGLYVRYDSKLYLMQDYTEELAKAHGAQNWGSFTFAKLQKYVTDHTDSEFLPDYLK